MFANFFRSFSLIVGSISALINLFILYLVYAFKQSTVGFYRIFLLCYIGMNLFCSLVTTIFSPMLSVNENSFIIFGAGLRGFQRIGSMCMVCFCFSVIGLLLILCFSYIYRYIVVCSYGNFQYLMSKGPIFSSLLASFFFGLFCGATLYWMLPNRRKNLLFEEHFLEHFGVTNISETAYIGAISYMENSIELDYLWIFLVRAFSFLIPICVILYCSFSIIRTFSRQFAMIKTNSKSATTRQYRLFILLILQSLGPMLLTYIPLTILFLASLLQYKNFILCDIFSVTLTISQFLDPLIVISCVSDYRQAVGKIVKKISSAKVTKISYIVHS